MAHLNSAQVDGNFKLFCQLAYHAHHRRDIERLLGLDQHGSLIWIARDDTSLHNFSSSSNEGQRSSHLIDWIFRVEHFFGMRAEVCNHLGIHLIDRFGGKLGRYLQYFFHAGQTMSFESHLSIHGKLLQSTHFVTRVHDYGGSRSACSASSACAVNIRLCVHRDAELYHQINTRNIQATGSHIGCYQDLESSLAELLERVLTLLLSDITVQHRSTGFDCAGGSKLIGFLLGLCEHNGSTTAKSTSVHRDNIVQEGGSRFKVARSLYSTMANRGGCHGSSLTNRVKHDRVVLVSLCNRLDPRRDRCRKQNSLSLILGRQELHNLVHIFGKAHGKHLIGLIKHKRLDVGGIQRSAVDEIVDTTRGTDDQMRRVGLENPDILRHAGATNASVALELHVITQGLDDLLDLLGQLAGGSENHGLHFRHGGVDILQASDDKGCGLAHTGLCLRNGIAAHDEGHDSTLLNRRRLLETVGINTTQQLLFEVHGIEGFIDLVIVGADFARRDGSVLDWC
mmetsp:Transcript_14782/g.25605  ORF Transcript_14782/g.25605 Transcript_14782/m.25605 type:complete len:510 (-) Transcript_14782:111-1640(-)